MSIFFIFEVFILGLFIGSFLNVLIDRLPRDEKITGRSYCENCKKTLSWKDLFPVLSYVYLRGKCRYCHAPLSYQYPFIELLTGLLFAFVYQFATLNFQFSIFNFQLLYYLFIVSCMIVVFFADLKYGIIPDKIILPAIIISLIWIVTNHQQLAISYLLSGVGAFLFFLFIYLITKGKGMGFGDIKLAFLIGLILGFPNTALALYIAFLTGGGAGFILILWKKKSMKYAVPFGPFLVLGTLISLFFADKIIPKVLPLFF